MDYSNNLRIIIYAAHIYPSLYTHDFRFQNTPMMQERKLRLSQIKEFAKISRVTTDLNPHLAEKALLYTSHLSALGVMVVFDNFSVVKCQILSIHS